MNDFLQGLHGWQYVWAVVITTAASFLGTWGRQWLAGRRTQKSAKAIEGMAQIYDVLNELSARTECDRALILYTSNGGGIPSTKSPVYTTILYELVHGPHLDPIRQNFQQVLIDGGYVRVLNEVLSTGGYQATVQDVPRGFLRDLYEAEGVHHVRMCELLRTPERYYFLALRWMGSPPPDAQIELAVLTAQSQIKKLLETY